jgi:hypothetical protein
MGNGGIVRFIRAKLRMCDGFLLQELFSAVTIRFMRSFGKGTGYYRNLNVHGGPTRRQRRKSKRRLLAGKRLVAASKIISLIRCKDMMTSSEVIDALNSKIYAVFG